MIGRGIQDSTKIEPEETTMTVMKNMMMDMEIIQIRASSGRIKMMLNIDN